MICSMTGQGRATSSKDGMEIEAEVRSVNNRFLKVTFKLSEVLQPFELAIEGIVREQVKRGSVHVAVRISGAGEAQAARISEPVLQQYLDQMKPIFGSAKNLWVAGGVSAEIGSLLNLPGVLVPGSLRDDNSVLALTIETVSEALRDLNSMRQVEGQAMADQLRMLVAQVRGLRDSIEVRAPSVLTEYRKRLEGRVRTALSELGHSASELDLLREVLQFSDRCDVREELVRLASHLDRFEETLSGGESQGRRLDFLIQEIFRETNTIGAKANDAAIAHSVVNIKTSVEQMRELVQNVE